MKKILGRLSNTSNLSKNKGLKETLRNIAVLFKLPVIIPVSFTSFTAYYLFAPFPTAGLFLSTLGVFLLGAAASALNQIQEKDIDYSMERTRTRPIPSGKMSLSFAWVILTIAIISGSVLLWAYGSLTAMLLGLFSILWYNGVYTYLKRVTAFAVVPGSLTGAIPPVIGWTAAGGFLLDKTSIILAFIFFIGQVPHFWLLILKYGKEYKKAGLPVLSDVFSVIQIRRLSFSWVAVTMASSLLLVIFGIIQSKVIAILLLIAAILTLLLFWPIVKEDESETYNKKYFIILNSYFLVLMMLLLISAHF